MQHNSIPSHPDVSQSNPRNPLSAPVEMENMIKTELREYDQSLFLDRNQANTYLCTICQFICRDPVTAECGNGHIFCRECITTYLTHSNQCPNCQRPIHSLHDAKFIDRLIQQLHVHCISLLSSYIEPYSSKKSQCEWTGPLCEAQAHYDTQCTFTLSRCPKCGMNLRFESLHVHTEFNRIHIQ